MKTTRPTQRRRERGNVLVLVVVVLVLLAMLGASYMQMARVQRVSDIEPIDNIDLVLQSVIDEIARLLKRDVTGDAANQFFLASLNIEPYDYPWTRAGVGTDTIQDPITGANLTVLRETNDDRWLAMSAPDFSVNPWRWNKTSILGRYYIRGNGAGDPNDLSAGITFHALNGSQGATPDYNRPHNTLVDSDNDGFGDSQWERAPIPLMTGVEYFAAVRVFDASALINIHSATAATSDGSTTGAELTGYFPTSLDLSRLFERRLSGGWTAPTLAIFSNVRAATPGSIIPTALGLSNMANYAAAGSYGPGQVGAWLDSASQPGLLSVYASALLELHRRNGVDNGTDDHDYEIYGAGLLDHGAGYDDSSATPIPDAQQHFLGTAPATLATNTLPSIRHMVTPLSGHALFSPNHGNMHGGAHRLKQDLVYENWGATPAATQARADAFRNRLQLCFTAGGSNYLGNAQRAAADFALAIAEYSDRDGKPTATWSPGGGVNHYALEALPFVREVYIQHGYEDPTLDRTWDAVANSAGIAIELGNPFDRPITFGGADGPSVRVAVYNGSTLTSSYTIPAGTTIAPRAASGSPENAEHLTIYCNPVVNVNDGPSPGTARGLDLARLAAIPAGRKIQVTPNGSLRFDTGSAVTVALEVEVSSGVWVAYDRFRHSALNLKSSYTQQANSPSSATRGIAQIAVKRDGQGIRYISNKNMAASASNRTPDETSAAPNWPDNDYSQTVDTLDLDNKGVNGDATLDSFQIPMANRPIFSVSELGMIVMFGFTNQSDGDFPARLSGVDGNGTPVVPTKTLDFAAAGIAAANNLNHAQIVLDEFTTLSPRHDAIDNNNVNGPDDNKEQFVFGSMNLNTAPRHLLAYSMPLPEAVSDLQTIADQIIGARQSQNGLKGLGGLFAVAALNTPAAPGGVYDQYPMAEETVAPAAGGQNAVKYNISGDAETRLKAIQMLTQGYTTRSDIFCASILVKGYKSGAFADGVVESGRILVVFSRANLTSHDDAVEVLGVYRY